MTSLWFNLTWQALIVYKLQSKLLQAWLSIPVNHSKQRLNNLSHIRMQQLFLVKHIMVKWTGYFFVRLKKVFMHVLTIFLLCHRGHYNCQSLLRESSKTRSLITRNYVSWVLQKIVPHFWGRFLGFMQTQPSNSKRGLESAKIRSEATQDINLHY